MAEREIGEKVQWKGETYLVKEITGSELDSGPSYILERLDDQGIKRGPEEGALVLSVAELDRDL